jgi:hypothetical protein
VAAVLGAEAAAADWARKPTAGVDHSGSSASGGAFTALGGQPAKPQRGDHEWALK